MTQFEIINVVYGLVFGLLVGSFLNVVIYRLPNMLFANWLNECRDFLGQRGSDAEKAVLIKENTAPVIFNLAYPRSHCPKCKNPVKAWQNIPLVSYLILKGRCGHCQTHISLRYPIIELVTGVITAFVIYSLGATPAGYLAVALTWSLIVLTMIDIDHQLLPDNITLPLMWLGLIANSFSVFTDINSAVLGAVFGYLSLWSVYWGFKLITGKEGMGFGDFKLLAALGAWMGWQMLPLIILLSSVVGAVIGISMMIIKNRDKNKTIPFGPYLAIAGWIALFWGDIIIESYMATL